MERKKRSSSKSEHFVNEIDSLNEIQLPDVPAKLPDLKAKLSTKDKPKIPRR